MKELLDTNVVSELRKVPKGTVAPAFARWAARSVAAERAMFVINVMEMRRGIVLQQRYDAAQALVHERWLLSAMKDMYGRILPVNLPIAEIAASLHLARTRPQMDALIAATAIFYDLTLVTRNTSDMTDAGVKLFNPWLDVAS